MLFSEEEAGLVSLMPIKPFTARKAARIWKKSLTETRNILDELAGRAILVDIVHEDETTYALPPPMAGFFEFSLMRLRDDIDQKLLSELYATDPARYLDRAVATLREGKERWARRRPPRSLISSS